VLHLVAFAFINQSMRPSPQPSPTLSRLPKHGSLCACPTDPAPGTIRKIAGRSYGAKPLGQNIVFAVQPMTSARAKCVLFFKQKRVWEKGNPMTECECDQLRNPVIKSRVRTVAFARASRVSCVFIQLGCLPPKRHMAYDSETTCPRTACWLTDGLLCCVGNSLLCSWSLAMNCSRL
jgi:hypothetical protein